MSDVEQAVNISDNASIGYADDFCTWVTGNDVGDVLAALGERSDAFAAFAATNGLVLNATKTQLMIGGCAATSVRDVSISVEGRVIKPGERLDLLGVCFDSKFSLAPHERSMASTARQRAGMIARLAHHLPRGTYLRGLTRGLVQGKLKYALAATATPRLPDCKSAEWDLNQDQYLQSHRFIAYVPSFLERLRGSHSIGGLKSDQHLHRVNIGHCIYPNGPTCIKEDVMPVYNALGSFDISRVATAEDCQSKCDQTSACRAYFYRIRKKFCYLYEKLEILPGSSALHELKGTIFGGKDPYMCTVQERNFRRQ
eukprot:maker-scaffold5_size1054832-snap-gene-7.9 protein:Tk04053 transcript:maker-scaffold5_size1054832-snap-gene-7.9-mRNA-1 annotation:"hypothetical protein CAPTEDRAFT_209955"